MLHVFTGSDVVAVRKAAHDFLAKAVGGAYDVCSTETYTHGMFLEYAEGQSLFGEPSPVLFDSLLEHDEIRDEFLKYAESFAQSVRTCVLIEESIGSKIQSALREAGAQTVDLPQQKKEERFNTFLLADALARKDKKSLWVLLVRAQRAGISPEEIVGTLFWQIKNARLAAQSGSAEAAGLKPFVYTKAKAAQKYYSPAELTRHSRTLVDIFHEGHKGSDMHLLLERFILSL